MADPTFLHSLTLEGFRAYLQPQTFDFGKKRCLAIFAPNGSGKSSLIDALEFLFSEQGTLERLGQRTLNNQAGPQALAHNGAQAAGILPMVKFATKTGKVIAEGSRAASGNQRKMPSTATAMNASFAADPIIRGHTLRTFVENQSPETRYSDVASWLQLAPLVEVQRNLRLLRRDVRAAAESTAEQSRLNETLRTEAAQDIPEWNDAVIVDFVNTKVIAPLDPSVMFVALNKDDIAYAELKKRAEAEEKQVGLAGLKQIRNAAAALWLSSISEKGGDPIITGAIADFDAALEVLANAQDLEATERDNAADTVFHAVWKEAEPLFADDATAPDDCPICATPVDQTNAGSVSAIRSLLGKHLDDLKTYREAKKALDNAQVAATQAQHNLVARLPPMVDHLEEKDGTGLKAQLVAYQAGVACWPKADAPSSAAICGLLAALLVDLDEQIAHIEAKQGDHTWSKAKVKIDRLLALKDEFELTNRKSNELIKLNDALTEQSRQISEAIRGRIQSLVDTLQAPMNTIYKEIQGEAAKPVRLQLPGEDENNQQRLQLVIDFAENRPSVPPAGYLSDSQIHSVALALRLAAIKRFNTGAPIIALDDVVTSYDADHRRAIAALISKMFMDCQMIIVTHDERFFNYLKDQLAATDWKFTRIIGLDPALGPRFSDHKVTDEMIEERWAAGQSAANEMRQAEEEWLLSIARGFGVNVRIRSLERAYSYERAELAIAIGAFLKEIKVSPADVSGINNQFITSLAKGEIENFGSHFQDGPYGDGSIGDERRRWEEFKAFRSQFVCPVCGRTKFQRPTPLKRPLCANRGCEAQFEFAGAPAAVSVSVTAGAGEYFHER
ncbi:MAG: AAA family ATPase [Pseudomonadota bacterium]